MVSGLIGRKIGMSQIFDDKGKVIPVTVLKVGPCFVSQIKTVEKEGYSSAQLAYEDIRPSLLSKAEIKHLEKATITTPKRVLKEFQIKTESLTLGAEIKAGDVFELTDLVKVTSISKGKGFQGVVKRYGHRGGPATHGSRFHRHPGSIGANSDPSRVFKGMKLPGRTGGVTKTVINLKVVKIDVEKNLILVSGSVPGNNKSVVTIEKIR
jgi:large subunit ribosomal protein L3